MTMKEEEEEEEEEEKRSSDGVANRAMVLRVEGLNALHCTVILSPTRRLVKTTEAQESRCSSKGWFFSLFDLDARIRCSFMQLCSFPGNDRTGAGRSTRARFKAGE